MFLLRSEVHLIFSPRILILLFGILSVSVARQSMVTESDSSHHEEKGVIGSEFKHHRHIEEYFMKRKWEGEGKEVGEELVKRSHWELSGTPSVT